MFGLLQQLFRHTSLCKVMEFIHGSFSMGNQVSSGVTAESNMRTQPHRFPHIFHLPFQILLYFLIREASASKQIAHRRKGRHPYAAA